MADLFIDLSRINGIYRKIAELCDIGERKGKLVKEGEIDEISLFNKAKEGYLRYQDICSKTLV